MTAVQPSTDLLPSTNLLPRTDTPLSAVPDPAQRTAVSVASVIGRQVFDVLAGRSGAGNVREHLTAAVFGKLLGLRLRGADHPQYRLRSVHACAIGDSAVEACLVVGAHRVRALALRLERRAERWVCTRLSPIERNAI
ncbi:Rv3235 family protein [Saccharopolyspora sp. NPDC049426]|uniref:Rv3235 family protein n=1 Tax=Saccharopolyspora sp. NPDC049426 TaxID=3155652 RepID=UPI00342E2E55